jgi:serine/threonine-protein kinase
VTGAGPAARRIGRYALFEEIAIGGTATVHLGRLIGDHDFARTVAIKRLHPHLVKNPEFVTMFLDEARLSSRIRHVNVAQTLDIVREGDEVFVVMEYVHGISIAALLRASCARDQRVPPPIAVSIISGVLEGLAAAHQARSESGEPLNLVHRDVSPENILVGADGVARLIDFGVAKAFGRTHTTRDGSLKGKLPYMAPEHVGGAATQQSDLFSTSIVLWELITGVPLFRADHEAAVLQRVLHGEIAPPSVAAHLDDAGARALDAVVLSGLARDPERRFPTARAMAQALAAALPFAPATEVAEYVADLCGRDLAERAAHVHASESVVLEHPRQRGEDHLLEPSDPPPEVPRHTTAPPPLPPHRARALVTVGVLGGVVAAAWALRLGSHARGAASGARDPSAPPSAVAEAARGIVPADVDADGPSASAPLPPFASPPDAAAAPSANAVAPPAASPRPPPAAAPRPQPAGHGSPRRPCNATFVDSAGRVHFREECL